MSEIYATPRRRGLLDLVEWAGNKLPDPTLLFIVGALLVMAISQIGAVQGWSIQPKKLEAVTTPVLDAAGQPALDAATGQPRAERALDASGNPQMRLVDAGDPIRVRGLLSGDGLYWALSSLVDNFVRFPPLGVVLVGMLGIGLAERTGFIGAALKAMMLVVPARLLTPTMVFLGIMSSLGTDAGYVVLPPVAAVLYKAAGRSPLAGIAAVFAGVAAGFNANLLITGLDPLLAGLSHTAARTIDPSYAVSPACNWWFMIASTFVITLAGWLTSSLFVERRLSRRPADEGGSAPVAADELAAQRLTGREWRALGLAALAVLLTTGAFAAMKFVPGGPLDDHVRGPGGEAVTVGDVRAIMAGGSDPRLAELAEGPLKGRDLAALAPATAADADPVTGARRLNTAQRGAPNQGLDDHFDRWVESIVPMLFFLFLIPGIVYGLSAGTLDGARQFTRMLVDTMAAMAPIIVLAFFAAQFIEYFKFSRLDAMLAHWGGQRLATAGLSPTVLIVAFILLTMSFNLLIGSMSAKYAMFAPIFVPMFMLVGISPELTQAAYRIGDSTSNVITPLNSYLIIILVVMQKYAPRAGMGTLIAMMAPYTLVFTVAWVALLLAWMAGGWPLGPDGPLWYGAAGAN